MPLELQTAWLKLAHCQPDPLVLVPQVPPPRHHFHRGLWPEPPQKKRRSLYGFLVSCQAAMIFYFVLGKGMFKIWFLFKGGTWLLFVVRETLGFAPGLVQIFAEGIAPLKLDTELNLPTALEDDCPMENRHCFEVTMECTSTELEPGLEKAPTCLTTRRKRLNKPTRALLRRWRPPARRVCL